MNAGSRLPTVVLISGRGSNLQAIIRAVAAGSLPLELRAVISNRLDAAGLAHAHAAGIKTRVLEQNLFAQRHDFDCALQEVIDSYQPELVVLAGFMRILGKPLVAHYRGRMLNIHPSLLPAFTGLHTHRRAIEASVAQHGASVHFVTDELDGGPLVIQASTPVTLQDTAETLAARVLQLEHLIYPLVLSWFAAGQLRLHTDHQGRDCVLFTSADPDYH